jgi:hypothetical protein
MACLDPHSASPGQHRKWAGQSFTARVIAASGELNDPIQACSPSP